MAHWEPAYWERPMESGLPRSERKGGTFHVYVPDRLSGASLQLPATLEHKLATVERKIRTLSQSLSDLEGIARFLLRSEAIASSRIEGIAPNAKNVAIAEIESANKITPSGHSHLPDLALLVAHNMTIVDDARNHLASSADVSVDAISALQAALLSEQPLLHGIRTSQNWIGGANFHPLDATFVPPAPEMVPELMNDLVAYMNSGAHSAIVQAALVHAQFETIHPYGDGNGRVGRALIQTVLMRRNLTPSAVLPISQILSTFRSHYVDGLTTYRHTFPANSPDYHIARASWIDVFTEATDLATQQASAIANEVKDIRKEWDNKINTWLKIRGAKRALRADSATSLIVRNLPATPVVTVSSIQRIHHVSNVAAQRALETLTEAGIMTRHMRRGSVLFQCDDILDLLTTSERRLASVDFDTRISPPVRPVPALPASQQPGSSV